MFPIFNSIENYPTLIEMKNSCKNKELNLIADDIDKYLNDFNNGNIDVKMMEINNIKYKIKNVYIVNYKKDGSSDKCDIINFESVETRLLFVYESINGGNLY